MRGQWTVVVGIVRRSWILHIGNAAYDEVTDRRVNWPERRQRIRRPNGYGPRRFGGLNG